MGTEAIPPTTPPDFDHDADVVRKSNEQVRHNTMSFLDRLNLLSGPPGLVYVDPEKLKQFIIDNHIAEE